jgi:hypothetical protein
MARVIVALFLFSILVLVTAACEILLIWPMSLGIPLILHVLCLIGVLSVAARHSEIFAEHPSFVGVPAGQVIARMENARRWRLRVEVICAPFVLVLGIVLFVLLAKAPGWQQIAGFVVALGVALLTHAAALGARDSTTEYTRHFGIKAMARILSSRREPGFRRSNPLDKQNRYALELEIMPPAAPPYRLTTLQWLRMHRLHRPQPGVIVPIKFLAEDPTVVVVFLNPGDPHAW